MQEFQVSRQPIPSAGYCYRESPVTSLPTRSGYDYVLVTPCYTKPTQQTISIHSTTDNISVHSLQTTTTYPRVENDASAINLRYLPQCKDRFYT